MIGIYKITSPTGRVYIGQSKDIERRFRTYGWLQCEGQARLYASLLKYGAEAHTFEVVEECTEKELLEKEIYWQKEYDVLNGGLNLKIGTEFTPEIEARRSKRIKTALKKRNRSEEQKKLWEDSEYRAHMSKAHRGNRQIEVWEGKEHLVTETSTVAVRKWLKANKGVGISMIKITEYINAGKPYRGYLFKEPQEHTS